MLIIGYTCIQGRWELLIDLLVLSSVIAVKHHRREILACWSDTRAAWNFWISWARWINKTEDLFLRDSYLIPCKPYPKGLPLSVPPPVLGHAAALAYCLYLFSFISASHFFNNSSTSDMLTTVLPFKTFLFSCSHSFLSQIILSISLSCHFRIACLVKSARAACSSTSSSGTSGSSNRCYLCTSYRLSSFGAISFAISISILSNIMKKFWIWSI